MSGNKLPPETIARIREEALKGKPKIKIAEEMGLCYFTVRKYAKDIAQCRKITTEIREKVREDFAGGMSRMEASIKHGISYESVYRITGDLHHTTGGWSGLRGKTLEAFNEILDKGYTLETSFSITSTILKHFPTIRKTRAGENRILYLPGKEKEAVAAFLENCNRRVTTYQELKAVTRVFGVELEKSEKMRFLGKSPGETKVKSSKEKKRRFCYRGGRQAAVEDFLGSFLHSELLKS